MYSERKDSEATAARLRGNRFYRAKRWEEALQRYMASLKARPYAVNTLANVAQVRGGCAAYDVSFVVQKVGGAN